MELVRNQFTGMYHHILLAVSIDGIYQLFRLPRFVKGKVCHLPTSMHAGVSTPRTVDPHRSISVQKKEGPLQFTLNRPFIRLELPS